MYCPSCGSEQLQGLKYCKRCGANLAPSNDASPARLGTMVWAVSLATTLVTVGGLAMVFIFAIEIMGRQNPSTNSLLFLLFFLLVVLGIAALLIRQLSRLLTAYLHSNPQTKSRPAELSEKPRAELPETPASVIGDLEQTTRRFEPARKSQKQ
jgi:hypothetical protein